MSAFQCTDYHISALAIYAESKDISRELYAKAIGKILHAENVKSVNWRYQEDEKPDFKLDIEARYAFFDGGCSLNYPKLLKACHCLKYQSCETSDYKDSEAYKILEAIESDATRRIKGYSEAPWGLVK